MSKPNKEGGGIVNRGFKDSDENLHYNDENNKIEAFEVLNEKTLEEKFSYNKLRSDNAFKSAAHYMAKYYKPSGNCMKNFFFARFPFFEWILTYDIKQNLVKDLIAGLTIGIVHIPQGMAYALMAGVPAINGLYVSFFTVILYVLFGTSRHLSTGTYAIVSLMVISSINRYNGILYPSQNQISPGLANTTHASVITTAANHHHRLVRSAASSGPAQPVAFISNDPVEAKVMIAMALAILSGIIQIIFSVLHIGFVTKYLSDSIVNGFTCGAAFHVVVSQISTLLDIKLGDTHIAFVLVGDFIEIFKNIKYTNLATLIISLISMAFLYIVKVHINERFKQKLPVPIPVELIVVVVGTTVSYFMKFNDVYKVKIIGFLPLGMPKPSIPPARVFSMVLGDSIAIAIVSFAINVSMAKLFAKKHKYEIKPNQELFAYGIGNVIAGVFKGFPACVGLSRCVILDGVGGKTQVYGIFSSILIVVVILFLGPLFRTLPNACLAAIIVIALKAMVLEVTIFPKLLKKSKMEALGWLVTYLGVMILDVDVGLYIGVGFSLLLVIFKSQRARTSVLGNIPGTNVFESIDVCEQAREFETIKIIRFEESIYYANVDNFKYKIFKLSKINPTALIAKMKKEKDAEAKLLRKLQKSGIEQIESQISNANNILDSIKVKHIVLDFSCVNYIDSQGVNAVLQLNECYSEIGIKVHITYCKQVVLKAFKKESFNEKFNYEFIYPSLADAIRHILYSDLKITQHTLGLSESQDMIVDVTVYPKSVYKARKEAGGESDDEEIDEDYITRF